MWKTRLEKQTVKTGLKRASISKTTKSTKASMPNPVHEYARAMRKNQTKAELCFWRHVRKRQILDCLFLRQYVIEHSNILEKRYFYIADFYCSAKKLVVEIDGPIHKEQIEYDEIKDSILKDLGFTVIRFTNNEVLNNWPEVSRKLKENIGKLPNRY